MADTMTAEEAAEAAWDAWQDREPVFATRRGFIAGYIAGQEAEREEIAELKTALVGALIPLEALNIDNGMGANWMEETLKHNVKTAITMGRAAIRARGGGQ